MTAGSRSRIAVLMLLYLFAVGAPPALADRTSETDSRINGDEIRIRIKGHPSTDSSGNPITVTAGPIGTWVPFTVGGCWADGHIQQYVVPYAWPDVPGEVRARGTEDGRLVAWQLYTPAGDPGPVHLQNQCDPNDFVPLPPPSPLEVWARTPLPTPSVLTSPRVKGLVGVPNLFWYEGPTTLTVPSITLGFWSVTAQGEIDSIRWFADDELVGAAEGSTLTGSEESPAAEGLFRFAGEVELRAEVVWSATATITYLPTGEVFTSDIGTATRTETRTYLIEERQASVNEGDPVDG